MNRRQVLRVLGGGAIAAAVPIGGCSSALPPEAIAAWNGPGAEPDVRRWDSRTPYAAIRRLLDVQKEGQTVQMWGRLGYGPPVGPAPRRGVDAHILHA